MCMHMSKHACCLSYHVSWACRDNGSIVGILRDGDTAKVTIDQLKALDKLLPDSGQVEMLNSFSGEMKKLGTAEDFFIRLLKVKQ